MPLPSTFPSTFPFPTMTLCGQCGRSGHNRRMCPSTKRKAPSGGGAGNDGRPARGGKSAAKRPRVGGGAGLHDPIQAARAAVAQATAEKAACEAALRGAMGAYVNAGGDPSALTHGGDAPADGAPP